MIQDPIPFFANLSLVANADGKLTASELGQLEAIRADLKIKKGDSSKARALVAEGSYNLTSTGVFSDQIHNLELMLRVAYADDDLGDSESEIIGKFCNLIGVTQEQIDRIEQEVVSSLKQTGKVCLSCGTSDEPKVKFCPGYGKTLIGKESPVLLRFTITATGIAIKFADSTAASFTKALGFAKGSPGYQTCQKNKKNWHLASYPAGSISDAQPVAEALSGIRNKTAYQNEIEKAWDELFGFTWCASKRAPSYRPAEYCYGKDENRLNPWGCKQARIDWTDWSDWFSYGS
ncbi:MAG: TerB family tellurite resistance protein [Luteolibacter sp.]